MFATKKESIYILNNVKCITIIKVYAINNIYERENVENEEKYIEVCIWFVYGMSDHGNDCECSGVFGYSCRYDLIQ